MWPLDDVYFNIKNFLSLNILVLALIMTDDVNNFIDHYWIVSCNSSFPGTVKGDEK